MINNTIQRILLFIGIAILLIVNANVLLQEQNKIINQNEKIINKIDSLEKSQKIVIDSITVTMYNPVRAQTNRQPYRLADGTYFQRKHASEYRYIAISRDLLKYFDLGDIVRIIGAGKESGLYQIRDLMNKRFEKRIDILESVNTGYYKYANAKIQKIKIN